MQETGRQSLIEAEGMTEAPREEIVQRPSRERRTEGILGVGLLVLAGGMSAWELATYGGADGMTGYAVVIAFVGAIGLVRAVFFPNRTQLTEAGKQLAKQREADASRHNNELLNRWYVRYPAAITLVAMLGWLTLDWNKSAWALVLVWIVGGGYALWWTREVSKWLLGIAAIVWLVASLSGAVSGMSTATAIIIGAIIIAFSIQAKK